MLSCFVSNGAVLSAMLDVISRKRLGMTGPSLWGALHNLDSLETKCQHLNLTLFLFRKLIPQALATIQSGQTPAKRIERKTSRHAPFSPAWHRQAASKARLPKCYEGGSKVSKLEPCPATVPDVAIFVDERRRQNWESTKSTKQRHKVFDFRIRPCSQTITSW